MHNMKIDFIHVGIHKTASTYLQKNVFPQIEGLKIINQEFDSWFYNEFIKINPYKFDSDIFLQKLKSKFDSKAVRCNNILAISEENISGDIYTGQSSKELMFRVKECFDNVQILIVLRNPIDYILSTYSNYILHGGTKSIKSWLFGQETRFGEILEKLHYSYLVNDYIETFGREKVTVILYEQMFDKKNGIHDFFKIFNLNCDTLKEGKVNVGRSLLANHIMSFLNLFNIYKVKKIQILFKYFPSSKNDRDKVRTLLLSYHESFNCDSKRLSKLLKISLPQVYFF
jgi:hypothetical protein